MLKKVEHPAERRSHTDRRRVAIPDDWPAARQEIEREFSEVWSAFAAMSDDVHAIRRLMERNTWRVGIIWAIAIAIGLAGLTILSRQIDRSFAQSSAAAQTAKVERIEAITDALVDIPRTPALRIQSGPRRGSPTVAALQARLPTVRGITARERDAACLRALDACQPP